jgi:sugar/nucleoside kinase (ribokinase family)
MTLNAVLVIGSVTIDRNECAGRTFRKIGGVATYAGLTYRRHGLPTWVACNVASADAAILAPLRKAGIQVQNGRTQHTTRFVNRIDGIRRTQEMPSIASPIRCRLVAAALKHVDCVHLGPLHPDDIDPEVFTRLDHAGAQVTLDIQGLVRRCDRGRIVPAVSDHLAAALWAADIVKSDQEELDLVLDAYGAGVMAVMKRFDIAEWVATSASKGGCIHVRGGRRVVYKPVPVDEPVDPTGAGDVFFAAYTAARLHLRRTPAAAGRHAARLSSEHVTGCYLPAGLLNVARA